MDKSPERNIQVGTIFMKKCVTTEIELYLVENTGQFKKTIEYISGFLN